MRQTLAVHVGDWLKSEIVKPAGVNVTTLAAHFGVSRQALSMLGVRRGDRHADANANELRIGSSAQA